MLLINVSNDPYWWGSESPSSWFFVCSVLVLPRVRLYQGNWKWASRHGCCHVHSLFWALNLSTDLLSIRSESGPATDRWQHLAEWSCRSQSFIWCCDTWHLKQTYTARVHTFANILVYRQDFAALQRDYSREVDTIRCGYFLKHPRRPLWLPRRAGTPLSIW